MTTTIRLLQQQHQPLFSVPFCTHASSGGECGYGTCINSISCVCEDGWEYDRAFMSYPNCFVPWYLYPAVHGMVGFACVLLVATYGIKVWQKVRGLQARVAFGANAFAGTYALIMLTHELESGLGAITQALHTLSIIIFCVLVTWPCMDLYIFPTYKFLRSPGYTKTKRLLKWLFWIFLTLFIALSIEAKRQSLVLGNISAFNDMMAYSHLVLGLFCLSVFLAFHVSALKLVRELESLQRAGRRERLRESASQNDEPLYRGDENLSAQAKEHLDKVRMCQAIVGPALFSAFASNFTLCAFHLALGVFRYQYIFFIGLSFPVPLVSYAILTLVDETSPSLFTSIAAAIQRYHAAPQAPTLTPTSTSSSSEQAPAVEMTVTAALRQRVTGAQTSRNTSNTARARVDSGASGYSLSLT